MRIEDLIPLCKRYSRMGWSVDGQLSAVLDGDRLEDQNPNALDMIEDFLRDCHEAGVSGALEIADDIRDHLAKEQAA